MATITAASASASDVQAAVNSAAHGDTVLIPNGTVTWTSGVDATAKRVMIRAQNYTATPAGAAGSGTTSRNVVITNNSSAALFSFTSGNDYHCGLAGVSLLDGSGNGEHIKTTGSGSKPPLVSDCYLTLRPRSFPAGRHLDWQSLGGVMWNMVIHPVGSKDLGQSSGEGILVKSPRAWATASTMGSLDTGGLVNVYFEDSTIQNASWADVDDNGRLVVRKCTLDGTWSTTHGFTSTFGGRHFEFYDNTFSVTSTDRNIASRYFWCRAGTGLFTDNVVNNAANPGAYGNISLLDIGDTTTPGTYPQNRQPGWGHDGSANVSDPIYIWNNTGTRGSTWYLSGGWDAIVQSGRDVFVDAGAKPGYTKYTYPHPLRSGESPPPPSSSTPSPLGNRGTRAVLAGIF